VSVNVGCVGLKKNIRKEDVLLLIIVISSEEEKIIKNAEALQTLCA
jgi:hypothetical protein